MATEGASKEKRVWFDVLVWATAVDGVFTVDDASAFMTAQRLCKRDSARKYASSIVSKLWRWGYLYKKGRIKKDGEQRGRPSFYWKISPFGVKRSGKDRVMREVPEEWKEKSVKNRKKS